MQLAGKRIVIIGGSSGLGLATAKLAAEMGARVVIAARTRERLERAAAEIGGEVEAHTVDVTREEQLKELFARLGEFDHIATPGNRGARGPFLELDTAVARAGFDSKFWGQYNAAKYAAPHLRPGGSIVLFACAYSQRPARGAVPQAAINAAVEGLGRALAVELAPIRVNVVSPGFIDTPLHDSLPEEQRRARYEEAARTLLVRRVGRAEEVAEAVLYLMSNSFTTGTTLYVDGGTMLR